MTEDEDTGDAPWGARPEDRLADRLADLINVGTRIGAGIVKPDIEDWSSTRAWMRQSQDEEPELDLPSPHIMRFLVTVTKLQRVFAREMGRPVGGSEELADWLERRLTS